MMLLKTHFKTFLHFKYHDLEAINRYLIILWFSFSVIF